MSEEAVEETPFEKLLGRASTAAEREQLWRVQSALGLRDNDALWLVLYALQFYESLYRQFPREIGKEAKRILDETRMAADATIRASVESAKADLAKAIASAARDVARDAARRQLLQWLVIGMLLGVALLVAGVEIGSRLAG
jgi:hypothetical protein